MHPVSVSESCLSLQVYAQSLRARRSLQTDVGQFQLLLWRNGIQWSHLPHLWVMYEKSFVFLLSAFLSAWAECAPRVLCLRLGFAPFDFQRLSRSAVLSTDADELLKCSDAKRVQLYRVLFPSGGERRWFRLAKHQNTEPELCFRLKLWKMSFFMSHNLQKTVLTLDCNKLSLN